MMAKPVPTPRLHQIWIRIIELTLLTVLVWYVYGENWDRIRVQDWLLYLLKSQVVIFHNCFFSKKNKLLINSIITLYGNQSEG